MTHSPTTEKKLAESFRAAHWGGFGGKAQCPDCFDGVDVKAAKARLHALSGLRGYWCKACRRRFTDATGTPLEHCSVLLSVWAQLAISLRDHQAIEMLPGFRELPSSMQGHLRQLREKLATWEFLASWGEILRAIGFVGAGFGMQERGRVTEKRPRQRCIGGAKRGKQRPA